MVEVKKYHLAPTALIPNSPQPILHYPGFLTSSAVDTSKDGETVCSPPLVHDTFQSNGWQTQWIFRYGQTQTSHYHSRVHECMAVLSGEATIRFGVADTLNDLNESTYGSGQEEGGIEVHAQMGDVFILPAGVAHKTFGTRPVADFALLTPGDGHQVDKSEHSAEGKADGFRDALAQLSLDGFTMIGAYPVGAEDWDFAVGGECEGHYDDVWAVAKPERDPVLGVAKEGICGQWK